MWVIMVGLLAGLLLGYLAPLAVPNIYARYLGIAVLAALDSSLGGIRASLERRFEATIFLTGFFTNALLAVALTYMGERLGIDLYMAAVVALGIRLFQNLGIIRRRLLHDWGWLPRRPESMPPAGDAEGPG